MEEIRNDMNEMRDDVNELENDLRKIKMQFITKDRKIIDYLNYQVKITKIEVIIFLIISWLIFKSSR